MNSNETNWIEKIKGSRLVSKSKLSRTKSSSSSSQSSLNRASPSEFEFTPKHHLSVSPLNQLNDLSSAYYINTNANNDTAANSTNTANLLIEANSKNDNLNEFDLNNNDLAYTSLCFDNIDLTTNPNATPPSTATTATTGASSASTNDKLDDQSTSSLGLKFVNTNHNPDFYQRSNSVPLKIYDSVFSQPNDLTNIDLNYPSLYFEAIDLCLPHTTSHHVQFDFSNAYDLTSKFMTQSQTDSTYQSQTRSNSSSVPHLNTSSDVEEESHNINTPRLETPCRVESHLEENDEQTNNLINESVCLENKIINDNHLQVGNIISHEEENLVSDTQNLVTIPAISVNGSRSPVKSSSKKSKSKVTNLDTLDQKSFESNEIKNDGVDLKPLIKEYYNMVYTCMIKLCGYEFEKNVDLVIHLKEVHQIELVNNDSISGKNGKLSYKCIFDEKTCGKKLETLNRLADHICKMHLAKIEYKSTRTAEKLFSPRPPLRNSQPEDEDLKNKLILSLNQKPLCFNNILICSYNQCLWSFQFEEALKLHKLKHKCGLDLNDQVNMEILKQKAKQSERNYACSTCNSKFLRPSHLKTHLKSHENTVFPCDYCTEKFFKINHLLAHINEKHKESEKIFRCPYEGCAKSYYCKMYLASHITKSHLKQQENESEKICTECNIKFKQVWLKRQHDEIKHKKSQNLKTLFKCTYEQCTKEFVTPSKLHRHNLTHLKAKSFKCEYENCNACFKRQYQLTSHLRTHTSANPDSKVIYYKCDQLNCRSKFKSREKLDIHKQSHLNKLVKNENDEEFSENELNDAKECLIMPNKAADNLKADSSELVVVDPSLKLNRIQQQAQQIFGLNNNYSNLKQIEFKCIYCQFKFDSNDQLNLHLKSHFDINKANQKLNDYLIELSSHQKENIKYQEDTASLYHSNTAINTNNNNQNQMKFINEEENEYSYLNLISETGDNAAVLNDNNDNKANNENKNHPSSSKTNDDESHYPSLSLDPSQSTHLIDYFDANNDNSPQIQPQKDFKDEHVININSDDEEYVTCSVVLENLSGSARTDYKSNHIYIEKYRLKRKNNERFFNSNKKVKGESEEPYESIVKSVSPLTTASPSSSTTSESLPSPPMIITSQLVDTTSLITSTTNASTSQTLNENLKLKLKSPICLN